MDLLHAQQVAAVVDVRSQPYSRFNPDANREALGAALKKQGIDYVYLGQELGARSADPAHYENGKVQYRRLAQSPVFRRGLMQVVELAQERRVALLCAEKEPLACHRTLLVARELEAVSVPVGHIHASGSVEAHLEAMTRLLRLLEMPESDLFRTRDELIAEACAEQEKRIAFVNDDMRVGVD